MLDHIFNKQLTVWEKMTFNLTYTYGVDPQPYRKKETEKKKYVSRKDIIYFAIQKTIDTGVFNRAKKLNINTSKHNNQLSL